MFGLAQRAPVARGRRCCRTRRCSRSGASAVRRDGERETLGLYLTGHPMDRVRRRHLPRFVSHRLGDLVSERPAAGGERLRGFGGGKPVTVAGEINEVKKRGPRTILTLDDGTGRLEVTLFDDVFQQLPRAHREERAGDRRGQAALRRVQRRLAARRPSSITELDKAREQQARRLVLRWPARRGSAELHARRLAEILAPLARRPVRHHRGIPRPRRRRRPRRSAPEWNVKPTRELIEQLESFAGTRWRAGRLRRAARSTTSAAPIGAEPCQ